MNYSLMEQLDNRLLDIYGKHKVQLDDTKAFAHWDQIHAWCNHNLTAPYTWLYVAFYFCNPEDAVQFSLTWGGT